MHGSFFLDYVFRQNIRIVFKFFRAKQLAEHTKEPRCYSKQKYNDIFVQIKSYKTNIVDIFKTSTSNVTKQSLVTWLLERGLVKRLLE